MHGQPAPDDLRSFARNSAPHPAHGRRGRGVCVAGLGSVGSGHRAGTTRDRESGKCHRTRRPRFQLAWGNALPVGWTNTWWTVNGYRGHRLATLHLLLGVHRRWRVAHRRCRTLLAERQRRLFRWRDRGGTRGRLRPQRGVCGHRVAGCARQFQHGARRVEVDRRRSHMDVHRAAGNGGYWAHRGAPHESRSGVHVRAWPSLWP